MADVNRGKRPLSPHLTIYRPQITTVMSIAHRLTGIGLVIGAVGAVWWLAAAATDASYFETIDSAWTTWFGDLVWAGLAWAFSYHLLNGIRHLAWDAGYGFELPTVTRSGQAVLAGSVVLTAIILIAA